MVNSIKTKEIKFYSNANGRSPIIDWLDKLDNTTKKRIQTRILRLASGNYGEFKRLNKDILELRLDFEAGYRIYFAEINNEIVLLLYGGNKKSQSKDIEKAINYFEEYRGIK